MPRKIMLMVTMALCAAAFGYCDGYKYESRGRRDPFVPLVGMGKPAAARLEDVTSISDICLEGIAIESKGKMTAIMNGAVLKEGDKVGEVEVRKISKNTVSLSIGGKQYDLKLSKEGGQKDEQ